MSSRALYCIWLHLNVRCDRDRACALSVSAVGIGQDKCPFVCVLYLQRLKEKHSTEDEFTLDSNANTQYIFQCLVMLYNKIHKILNGYREMNEEQIRDYS